MDHDVLQEDDEIHHDDRYDDGQGERYLVEIEKPGVSPSIFRKRKLEESQIEIKDKFTSFKEG